MISQRDLERFSEVMGESDLTKLENYIKLMDQCNQINTSVMPHHITISIASIPEKDIRPIVNSLIYYGEKVGYTVSRGPVNSDLKIDSMREIACNLIFSTKGYLEEMEAA